MTWEQWIFGVGGGLALLAFVIFSFWQGLQVRPRRGSTDASDARDLVRDSRNHNILD